ncbi:hypothetical protein KIPB_013744, partial [Kipferlia bialata]|eukprot:g13744.t1
MNDNDQWNGFQFEFDDEERDTDRGLEQVEYQQWSQFCERTTPTRMRQFVATDVMPRELFSQLLDLVLVDSKRLGLVAYLDKCRTQVAIAGLIVGDLWAEISRSMEHIVRRNEGLQGATEFRQGAARWRQVWARYTTSLERFDEQIRRQDRVFRQLREAEAECNDMKNLVSCPRWRHLFLCTGVQ